MSVSLAADGTISLAGACPAADAEPLLRLLADAAQPAVDWSRCESAHAAVVQVLLAARPRIIGSPADAFLGRWVAPLLADDRDATSRPPAIFTAAIATKENGFHDR